MSGGSPESANTISSNNRQHTQPSVSEPSKIAGSIRDLDNLKKNSCR